MKTARPCAEQHILVATLGRFPELRTSVGAPKAGWIAFDDLGAMHDVELEKHLALQAMHSPGLDRRGQGAFLISKYAYALASLSAVLHLHHRAFPLLTNHLLSVSLGGQESAGLNLRLAYVPETPPRDTQSVAFADHFVARLTPLVERLHVATRLGQRAQWRLAGDMLAAAFLHYGKLAGCADQAETDVMAALAPCVSPMSNRQVGFQAVSTVTAEGRCRSDRFIKRGGCCRYYTATGGKYCSTCVLRKPDDQQHQLQNYLRELS